MTEHPPQPEFLDVGALRMPLRPGPEGPKPNSKDDEWHSLTWILSCAAYDDSNEMYQDIQAGRQHDHEILQIRPVLPEDDVEKARTIWKRFTKTELEGELCAMYVGGDDTSIIPLAALQEGVRTLKELKEKYRIPPPWLFMPEPRWSRHHRSEHATIMALEKRMLENPKEAEADLEGVGLTDTTHGRRKLNALLTWSATTLASRYTEFLLSRKVEGITPPPWLFHPGKAQKHAHPSEREPLSVLEKEAGAIDAAEQALDGALDPPDLLKRRSAFLLKLRDAGLLSGERRDAKLHTLHGWELKTLGTLYQAALDALFYLRSSERHRYNPDAQEREILDSPICLDIFRGLKLPEGVTRFAWISWGEFLLRKHGPKKTVTSDQGDFPYHDKDGLVMVIWRKDAGVPALRYVSLQSGPRSGRP